MLPDFTLVRPASLDDALAAIDEDHVPLCGGTELLLVMAAGMLAPDALVDISRLDELRRLGIEGDEIVLGGAVTHRDVHRHPDVRARLPLLAEVTEAIGNARVRAQGSVGGNLCFAEPKSDLATALIALDADVVLVGPQGRRRLPVATFLDGPYTTVREETELLTEIRIGLRPRRSRYVKFQVAERPTVAVAAVAEEGRLRVVVGAVGPVPVHRDFAVVSADEVDALLAEVDPLADLTGSEEYKRHLTRLYVGKAMEGLA